MQAARSRQRHHGRPEDHHQYHQSLDQPVLIFNKALSSSVEETFQADTDLLAALADALHSGGNPRPDSIVSLADCTPTNRCLVSPPSGSISTRIATAHGLKPFPAEAISIKIEFNRCRPGPMWNFVSDAFLSVVADKADYTCERLLVRARRSRDIERVFPEAEVFSPPQPHPPTSPRRCCRCWVQP